MMEKYGRHRGVREAQEQGHAFPAEGAAEGPERRGRQEANDGRGTTLRKAEEEAVDRRQLVLFGNQYTKQLELPPRGLNQKSLRDVSPRDWESERSGLVQDGSFLLRIHGSLRFPQKVGRV